MKTKHTQGEWEVNKHPLSTTVVCNGNDICLLMSGLSEVNKCNGKLIAAAPELLEACQEAIRIVDLWAPSYSKENIKESDISELAALSIMRRNIERSLKKATE